MSAQNTMVNQIDPCDRWLYRVGCISTLLFGISYFIIVALYAPMGSPPPGSVETRLVFLAEHSATWWGILSLSVLTDLLYIPIVLALYFALKGISKSMMLVAYACIAMFVIMELGITWLNYAALLNLAKDYMTTTDESQKTIILTAAHYPFAVLDAHHLLGVYTILTNGIGVFLIGLVMQKGVFNKATAYLALIASSLTILAIVGTPFIGALWICMIIGSLLIGVWIFLVGYKLYQMSWKSPME